MRRWRGLKAMVHDAVDHTADLVEEANRSVAKTAVGYASLLDELAAPARTIAAAHGAATAGVVAVVKAVNRAVEAVTDAGLDVAAAGRDAVAGAPVPLRSDVTRSAEWIGDAALGAVNGAVGDYLYARGNGLALDLSLRANDRYLPLERDALGEALGAATGRLAIFVHGLGATEWSWCLGAEEYYGDATENFGARLARDLGFTPVFVRYNTGRHISENGRELAEKIEALVANAPVAVTEVTLIGHSMGGLVARSACHYAREGGLAWPSLVRAVFCLGSPHRGAALEKISHVAASVLRSFDAPGAWIPGRVLDGRSAGVKDLRYGYVVDEEWLGLDPDALLDDRSRTLPLLDGVRYYFVAATVTRDAEHPVAQILGDLLVRVESASGPRVERAHFPIETRHFGAVMHHQLQNHPDVYELIRGALA